MLAWFLGNINDDLPDRCLRSQLQSSFSKFPKYSGAKCTLWPPYWENSICPALVMRPGSRPSCGLRLRSLGWLRSGVIFLSKMESWTATSGNRDFQNAFCKLNLWKLKKFFLSLWSTDQTSGGGNFHAICSKELNVCSVRTGCGELQPWSKDIGARVGELQSGLLVP